MKLRSDFVTNSSSSSFMILKKDEESDIELMYEVNDFLKEKLHVDKDFPMNESLVPKRDSYEHDGEKYSYEYYDGLALYTPKHVDKSLIEFAIDNLCLNEPESVWGTCSYLFDLVYNQKFIYSTRNYSDAHKKEYEWHQKMLSLMTPEEQELDYDDFEYACCKHCIEEGFCKDCHKKEAGISLIEEIMNSDVVLLAEESYISSEIMEELCSRFKMLAVHKHMG